MNAKNFNKVFICLIGLLFSGCKSFGNTKTPYAISGEFSIGDETQNYAICGIQLNVFNKSELEIKNITVVFYLFDSDGEPIDTGRNNIVLSVGVDILPKESKEICISLDEFMTGIPDEIYSVDYLYLSKICYEDGSEWTDPFGMMMF